MRKSLAHFALVEQLGAGGMGVVYRAHDPRLDRDVAIKVLAPGSLSDPDARKRLRKEALAISKLNHPNIAVVHDFSSDEDVDFLVMELVPGTMLDQKLAAGPLPERDVVALGLQLADALATAHKHGVIHRDLKPGNLRVTPEGRLKVLDFGLARTLHAAANAQTESVLENDSTSGTLPYMAPEQLRGDAIDERSDSGPPARFSTRWQRAGARSRRVLRAALAGDILHRPVGGPRALRPDLSLQLEQITLRCLEKNPSDRYQSASQLAEGLRRLSTPSSTGLGAAAAARRAIQAAALIGTVVVTIALATVLWRSQRSSSVDSRQGVRTLAVMPLENLSGDEDQQYLADGLTDALITDLARVERLKVIAKGSVARGRHPGKSLAEIASKLGADAFVEGSIQRSGQQVRISARLVDAATSTHLWAQTYERELKDLLRLQSEVARAVASEVLRSSDPKHPAGETREVDPAVHEAYLRGRYFWNKRTVEDLNKAVSYFQQAADKDPAYAPAYSGLADSYVSLYDYGYLSAADVTAKARIAARRAWSSIRDPLRGMPRWPTSRCTTGTGQKRRSSSGRQLRSIPVT